MKAQPYDPAATPASNQFVFSTAEIELEARRQSLRADAQNARSHHYNLADYNKSALRQAA